MERAINILVLASPGFSSVDISKVEDQFPQASVTFVCLTTESAKLQVPERWCQLAIGKQLDLEELRNDFLTFLDRWPRYRFAEGKSFDEMFRLEGGYSVWWTGPGMKRHPSKGIFPTIRSVWIAGKAIEAVSPDRILIFAGDRVLATVLASRCDASNCQYSFLPDSARPSQEHWAGRPQWLASSLVWLILFPWKMLLRACFARLLAGMPRKLKPDRKTPAVTMSLTFPKYIRFTDDCPYIWYWDHLCSVMEMQHPDVQRCFFVRTTADALVDYKMPLGLFCTGWSRLRKIRSLLPLPETHACWCSLLKAVWGQVSALIRYARLERTDEFRQSFCFNGVDVSSVYVPRLRRSVSRMAGWAYAVAAAAASLRATRNIDVMLVDEEFYGYGQIEIAAARKLGILTVGTQHGTIFPGHLIYTLPPGQVAGSPTPDYFAAYGQFAKEVVSKHGSYPAERVWITGGPRFDRLINDRPNQQAARQRLGLQEDKKIVLLATQFYPWFQNAAENLFQNARNRDNCVVCLKTHPTDVPVDIYQKLAVQAGAENVLFFTDRFDDLLAACDVLVSGSSTTLFEAILLGKRAICVNFSDEPDRYPYVESGGALPAGSAEEMRTALDQALSSENESEWEARRQKFLDRHAGPSAQGKAAETLAKHLSDLLGTTENL